MAVKPRQMIIYDSKFPETVVPDGSLCIRTDTPGCKIFQYRSSITSWVQVNGASNKISTSLPRPFTVDDVKTYMSEMLGADLSEIGIEYTDDEMQQIINKLMMILGE